MEQPRLKLSGITVLPALITVMLPKCPLCWMGILSVLGVNSAVNFVWLQSLTVFFLILCLISLAFRARQNDNYAPLILGAAASGAIYSFKFLFDYERGVYIAGAMLAAASIWSISARKKKRAASKCDC